MGFKYPSPTYTAAAALSATDPLDRGPAPRPETAGKAVAFPVRPAAMPLEVAEDGLHVMGL